MVRALTFVIAAGLGIGLALPSGEPPAEPARTSGEARETRIERENNGHFYVHAKVNGELVRFVVDTGASSVALTEKDARRVGIQFSPREYEYIGQGASGPVKGKLVTIDEVDVDGKKVENVEGVVLADSQLSLLGQSYLSRMGEVQMRGDYMVLR